MPTEAKKNLLKFARMADTACTCIKDSSAFCKYPHPCRHCYQYHPGVSCYWHAHGKTPADKKVATRTFVRLDGSIGCDEWDLYT